MNNCKALSERGTLAEAALPGVPFARVRALLANAATHYQDSLRATPEAVSYLRDRGIGGAAAARFGLGFASQEWCGLASVLQDYDADTVQASGLAIVKEGALSRQFDRFRGRIMFPIRDRSGAVAGFGGRVLIEAGDQPKYVNSPESACFQKRALLYGVYEAQDAIKACGLALVVEGYLDVVALSQAGFLPAVATLGTACNPFHIVELLSLSPRVVFCFDGDAAGRRAAARALAVSFPFATDNHSFDFLFLPVAHDPDSYVRAHGLAAFHSLLSASLPLSVFMQQQLSEGCNLCSAEGIALCLTKAKQVWSSLPEGRVRNDLLDFCVSVSRFSHDEVLGVWGFAA